MRRKKTTLQNIRRQENKQLPKTKRNDNATTNLSLEGGQRRLALVSMNVDDVRTHQKRTEIINRIRNLNTDIACIQETNDAITTKTQIGEYIIYQGEATDTCGDTQNTIPNINPKHQKCKTKRGEEEWEYQ